jgi:subtilisin family serine protease
MRCLPVPLAALVAALLSPLVLIAPPTQAAPGPPAVTDGEIASAVAPGPGLTAATLDPNATLSLIVRLPGTTLAEIYQADQNRSQAEGRAPMSVQTLTALHQAMVRRQQPTARAIEALGATVVDRYQVIANGFLVHARGEQVAGIARLPGVASVARAPIHHLDLKDSVPFIGAQRVIDELHFDGAGATVAVIDTGIDYTHEALGGSGNPEEYNANDENMIEPGSFPTAKVIGGYDFAGQRYSPGCPQAPPPGVICTLNPTPDEDPLDPPGQGHGSHVSGIVAGRTTAVLHSGVAPAARLVGLKVFGDPVGAAASTDLAGSALEWAAQHNMGLPVPGNAPAGKIDVINMSLGSAWGYDWTIDCAAVSAAAAAGITVVASSGNSGAVPYVHGTPSACSGALAVASSYASGEEGLGIHNEWVEGGQPVSFDPDAIQGAAWLPQLSSTGTITGTLAWYGLACNDLEGNPSEPAQDVNEKIALIERGTCTFYEKIWNAAKKGAIAVVVFTDAPRDKVTMGCGAPSDCDNGPGIPGVMIDRAPGLRLQGVAEQGIEITTVLDPNYVITLEFLTDAISSFSSRGPGRVDNALKPQITAPGSNIFSVAAGSGTQGASLSGTSMSSPTVAGVAALLWQRNHAERLGMSAADVAALAMNYAQPTIKIGRNDIGPTGAVTRQGAGRADAWRSATGDTLVRTPEGFAALGFADLYVDTAGRESRVLTVRNLSTAAKTYEPSSRFMFSDDDDKGIAFSFEPAMLTVPAGQTGELMVTLEATGAGLRPWPNRLENWVSNEAQMGTYEMDGQVLLTEVDAQGGAATDGGDVVGVPFFVLPRQRACVSSASTGPFFILDQGGKARQTWSNDCDLAGEVEPLALVGSDPVESAADDTFLPKVDIDTVGVRWGPLDPMTTTTPTVLEFQIHTQGGRRIPLDSQWYVFLDFDQDGDFERAIYNRAGPLNLQWSVAHAPVITGTLAINATQASAASFGQAFDVNESTTVLLVDADDLGLDLAGGQVTFDFAVRHIDGRAEWPQSDSYPGYDDAPDGISGTASPTFTFDQAKLECLKLVGADGTVHGVYGEAIAVPPHGAVSVDVTYGCAWPSTPQWVGFAAAYPLNPPWPWQVQVRRGLLDRMEIYLPSAER